MTPPVMTPEQESEAAILYSEHEWTCAEVAAHFGVSPKTIQRALHRLGIAMRPRAAQVLRVKQCSACLGFMPAAMFFDKPGGSGKESRCRTCKEHATPALRWTAGPLTQAVSGWRVQ